MVTCMLVINPQFGLCEVTSSINKIKGAQIPDYAIKTLRLDNAAWGHAILHGAALVRIRPTSYHKVSPIQLAFGQEPNISHLFGCVVYVPIAPPQRTKMGPQRRLEIYVGYESPSIIKYLEPMTGDLFTARFADFHFDESVYPILGGENKQLQKKIDWNALSLSHLDPRTNQCEHEVQKIIYLQNIANQLPDAFTNLPRVTKSHIPAANASIRIDVPVGQSINANESNPRLKLGRPIGSKDKNPRMRKGANDLGDHNVEAISQKETRVITNDKTSEEVQPVGYKWVFVRKRNNKNEVVRYKARPMAQGFLQRPVIDYMETYSPMVDAITFRFLINLAVHEKLDMRLMDVVTALYGTLDNEIYMKIPEGLKVPETNKKFRETYSIKLQKFLYGLKQSGRI
ncbi:PREDICTED: uncharacterized protein LOC109227898 [Nicotiana attenuata]|uniref:uncharacterized protein LOC109227898 n=1 Tax=Nicotiana attenuata TaxID=49451 RepID=UPI000904DC55|nr:PREDICTED: uncharacterized protein LOC109227898 [Nicotiana attenuata]